MSNEYNEFDSFDNDDFGSIDEFDTGEGFDIDGGFDLGTNSDRFDSSNELSEGGNTGVDGVKSTKKTAIVAIICGIVLIALVFGAVNLFGNILNKEKSTSEKPANQNQNTVVQDTGKQQQKPSNTNNSSVVIEQTETGWLVFEDAGNLNFKEDLVDATFTVQSVKHYVKVTGDNALMIKTIVNGTLTGFVGNYELEVPYTLGKYLEPSKYFEVKVQVGVTEDGKSVIGEILYE